MNYCEREPIHEERITNTTIKSSIQETYKLMCEMKCALDEMSSMINGQREKETDHQKDACCLWEESQMLVALAHENMMKLIEVRGSII